MPRIAADMLLKVRSGRIKILLRIARLFYNRVFLGIFPSVGMQFIHNYAVVPLSETDSVWYGRIKSSAGTIGINGSSDFRPYFLLRDILDIYFRTSIPPTIASLPSVTLWISTISFCAMAPCQISTPISTISVTIG